MYLNSYLNYNNNIYKYPVYTKVNFSRATKRQYCIRWWIQNGISWVGAVVVFNEVKTMLKFFDSCSIFTLVLQYSQSSTLFTTAESIHGHPVQSPNCWQPPWSTWSSQHWKKLWNIWNLPIFIISYDIVPIQNLLTLFFIANYLCCCDSSK